jgi:hypothetical protein
MRPPEPAGCVGIRGSRPLGMLVGVVMGEASQSVTARLLANPVSQLFAGLQVLWPWFRRFKHVGEDLRVARAD